MRQIRLTHRGTWQRWIAADRAWRDESQASSTNMIGIDEDEVTSERRRAAIEYAREEGLIVDAGTVVVLGWD